VNPAPHDAIGITSLGGYTGTVKLLLSAARVTPPLMTIMHSKANGPEIVTLLLSDARVNPTVQDNYAIHRAIQHGHGDTLTVLLQGSFAVLFCRFPLIAYSG
jgi:hypothetical protein